MADNRTVKEVGALLFRYVGKELRAEWTELADHLGVTPAEIYGINQDYQNNVREQIYQMLLTWQKKMGKAATREKLAQALRAVNNVKLAEEILVSRSLRSFSHRLFKLVITVAVSVVFKFGMDYMRLDECAGYRLSWAIVPLLVLSALWILFPDSRIWIQCLTAVSNLLKSLK